MLRHRLALFVLFPCTALLSAVATVGGPSMNHILQAVPTPAGVVVDGALDEWDLSGQIWLFADARTRDRTGVKVAAMYDEEAFYIAGTWRDTTPMLNRLAHRPQNSDCMTLYMQTDTTWTIAAVYDSIAQEPILSLLSPAAGLKLTDALSRGAELSFRKDSDGKGYVHELKLPWELLFRGKTRFTPGTQFRLAIEPTWGGGAGLSGFHKTWFGDVLNPEYRRGRYLFRTKPSVWGTCVLEPAGDLERAVSEAIAEQPAEGVIPLDIELPLSAAKFTVAIDSDVDRLTDQIRDGSYRVCSLLQDRLVSDYPEISRTTTTRTVRVMWDGLSDDNRPVTPGAYRVRGLSHAGLDVTYQLSYYNPGDPPWENTDGTGAWGADHTCPMAVACAGAKAFIGWPHNEGGADVIGLSTATLKKIWHGPGSFSGTHGGVTALAANSRWLYCAHRGGAPATGAPDPCLTLRDLTTGAVVRNIGLKELVPDYSPPTGLPMHPHGVANLANGRDHFYAVEGGLRDIDVTEAVVAISLGGNDRILVLDASTLDRIKDVAVQSPDSIAFGPEGRLYVVTGKQVVRLDVTTGEQILVPTPGIGTFGAIAVDDAGNLYAADLGADMQVKVFDGDGNQIRTAGRKGGRPDEGLFDPQGMRFMSSVDVDADSRIWVVECDDRPRRVSVWGQDGKLVRDYIGNPRYHGSGGMLHPTDPTRAFGDGMEFKLDYENQSWRLVSTMWRQREGEYIGIWPIYRMHWYCNNGDYITSGASGTMREYWVDYSAGGHTILMPEDDHWTPVCALGRTRYLFDIGNGFKAQGPFVGHEDELYYWFDENRNGKTEADELAFSDSPLDGGYQFWWDQKVRADLVLYLGRDKGVFRLHPVAWTDYGAPRYDIGKAERVTKSVRTRLIAHDDGFLSRIGCPQGLNKAGEVIWKYRPRRGDRLEGPGLLRKVLRFSGIADMGGDIGKLFAMRGQNWEDIFTIDGLYVGRLFKSRNSAPDPLPDTTPPPGTSINDTGMPSEPFGGWFGRHPDGRVRMVCGDNDWRVCEVLGLDTVKRFGPHEFTVTAADRQKASELRQQREARAGKNKPSELPLRIAPLTPVIDGGLDDWPAEKWVDIIDVNWAQKAIARASAAYDGQNLYLAYEVSDATPMRNSGKDVNGLFKTGDAVDFKLGTDPSADAKRKYPVAGDWRILISVMDAEPVAVLYRPIAERGQPRTPISFSSFWSVKFDDVRVLPDADIRIARGTDAYRVEAALPLAALDWIPTAGQQLRGDAGVIFSDAKGLVNIQRVYWANRTALITADVPSESRLEPRLWGKVIIE